jgi:VIT1/CCC1 family predicted Fe2+/Mn2+ transporter
LRERANCGFHFEGKADAARVVDTFVNRLLCDRRKVAAENGEYLATRGVFPQPALNMTSSRESIHREPKGAKEIAQHYLRDLVYGANDGIITTFAVVAGVAGGALSARAVLIVGAANLIADGLSMGVGNYLGIRSQESPLAARGLPEEESSPVKHAAATFLAFLCAGTIPLLPYVFMSFADIWLSSAGTFSALFIVGALRSVVTVDRWWIAGGEMLALGVVVAAAAYAAGAVVGAALR